MGAATAWALAHGSPHALLLVGRSASKCQPLIDQIRQLDGSIMVKFFVTDLSSQASVRNAAKVILADRDIEVIDTVINNAGIIVNDLERTEDGLESQYAVNHLSHFLLTNLLLPLILKSDTPRVVNISSLGHKYSHPPFPDPYYPDPTSYQPAVAYSHSKGSQVLFSIALNEKLGGRGLRSFAIQPGNMLTTLYTHLRPDVGHDMTTTLLPGGFDDVASMTKSVEGGSSTGLVAALAEDLPPGVYMDDCQVTHDEKAVAAWALDPKEAEECWNLSEKCVGQVFQY